VPADDFTDPAAVHTFSHLSASIVLSRMRASEGLYPAIDPLQSSSKIATPTIVGKHHYALAQEIRRTLAQYSELKDIIAMLGLEELSEKDRAKPAEILEKIISGKINQIVNEVTLYGQPYVLNTDQTVEQAVKAAGADVVGFSRLAVGEGIEKAEEDFAAEVMKQAGLGPQDEDEAFSENDDVPIELD
jgi:F0F1-type ATP synthase beta subunit